MYKFFGKPDSSEKSAFFDTRNFWKAAHWLKLVRAESLRDRFSRQDFRIRTRLRFFLSSTQFLLLLSKDQGNPLFLYIHEDFPYLKMPEKAIWKKFQFAVRILGRGSHFPKGGHRKPPLLSLQKPLHIFNRIPSGRVTCCIPQTSRL